MDYLLLTIDTALLILCIGYTHYVVVSMLRDFKKEMHARMVLLRLTLDDLKRQNRGR